MFVLSNKDYIIYLFNKNNIKNINVKYLNLAKTMYDMISPIFQIEAGDILDSTISWYIELHNINRKLNTAYSDPSIDYLTKKRLSKQIVKNRLIHTRYREIICYLIKCRPTIDEILN